MATLSDFERLQQELAEARQALVEAERKRQEERQQAEQEREQERQRAEQAEQRQQQAERERQYERQRNQPTTLDEFLEACHVHISKPLAVQADRSLSTGGGITKPNNRHYPQKLRQWTHFPDTQARIFHRLHAIFHPASEPPFRMFDPMIHLEVLGPKLCDRPLASEADLQQYERPAVEQPVTSVISALRDRSVDSIFDVGNGIIFESHPNTLSDMSEKVQQRQQQRRQRRQAAGQSADTNMRPKNTDQICIYKDTSGRRTPLFIIEYKPPHKLSVGDLLWGLREDMSILEVIERDTIPTDLKERSEHNSDEVVAIGSFCLNL
jgi:multidrug efflux pump subunit AcrA (membrane-fusion protein)